MAEDLRVGTMMMVCALTFSRLCTPASPLPFQLSRPYSPKGRVWFTIVFDNVSTLASSRRPKYQYQYYGRPLSRRVGRPDVAMGHRQIGDTDTGDRTEYSDAQISRYPDIQIFRLDCTRAPEHPRIVKSKQS